MSRFFDRTHKCTVIRSNGGFLGVNMAVDRTQLGEQYARDCMNVHVAFGAIERRPGIVLLAEGVEGDLSGAGADYPRELYFHNRWEGEAGGPDEEGKGFILAVAGTTLYSNDPQLTNSPWNALLASGNAYIDALFRPGFYRCSRKHSLILGGLGPVLWTDGNVAVPIILTDATDTIYVDQTTMNVQVPAPDPDLAGYEIPPGESFRIQYVYSYSTELTDSPEPPFRTEGKATTLFSGASDKNTTTEWQYWSTVVDINEALANRPAGQHINIYRSILIYSEDTLVGAPVNQMPPATLVTSLPPSWSNTLWGDFNITADADDSRYVPVLNSAPPNALFAVEYGTRMVYAGGKFPETAPGWDKIWWSQELEFGHVTPDSWQQIGTDGGAITGLAVYFGQLVIFKESSIWVIRGELNSQTNEDVQTGFDPPALTWDVERISSETGVVGKHGGKAWIEVDGLLYFAGSNGFYVFNGQTVRRISEPIDPLIGNLDRVSKHEIHVGHDEYLGIITWLIQHPGESRLGGGPKHDKQSTDDPLILAYHYRDFAPSGEGVLGRWTFWRPASPISALGTWRKSRWFDNSADKEVVLCGFQDTAYVGEFRTGKHKDEIIPGTKLAIDWYWKGGDLWLDETRATRWLFMAIMHEPGNTGTLQATFELDRTPEVGPLLLSLNNPSGVYKRRIFRRGRYFAPVFSGTSSEAARILGFEVRGRSIGLR